MAASTLVAPSVLSVDFGRLGEQLRGLDAAGADWIHADVTDGRLVRNITIGRAVLQIVGRSSAKPLTVRFMIVEPEHHLTVFADTGADYLLVQVEPSAAIHRTLGQVRAVGKKAATVPEAASPPELLEYVLHLCDIILVMTVNSGFGSQSFPPEMLLKIGGLGSICAQRGFNPVTKADGGENQTTAGQAAAASATATVAGSAIFCSNDYTATIRAGAAADMAKP